MSKRNVKLKYEVCDINQNSDKKVLETFEAYLKMGIFFAGGFFALLAKLTFENLPMF